MPVYVGRGSPNSASADTMSRLPNLLKPRPKISMFGMKCVNEEGLETQQSSAQESTTTHLQHVLSIYRDKGPSATIPDKKYIASDCMDHFVGGTATWFSYQLVLC